MRYKVHITQWTRSPAVKMPLVMQEALTGAPGLEPWLYSWLQLPVQGGSVPTTRGRHPTPWPPPNASAIPGHLRRK